MRIYLGHLNTKDVPESNFEEVVHLAWVTQKRKQFSWFVSAIGNICDMITTKQMLKGYGNRSSGRETAPSIQCLHERKPAQNYSILTKTMHSNSSSVNTENECSPT